MSRVVKAKTLTHRVALRKAATTASAASRRSFPAWISADDPVVAFPARVATPRVRDGLVLRTIARKKNSSRKKTDDAPDAR